MKYFTTEWYREGVASQMHEPMRKTQNAAQFSEKFFEKLCKLEKKAFVRYYKRAARFQRQSFDATAAEKQFDVNYEENLAFVKENLPEDILADVKDVRVLALGSVEYDVAARIERYCGKLKKRCRDAEEQYEEQLELIAEAMGLDTVNALDSLIDTQIELIEMNGSDLVIGLWGEETRANITVILRGAQIPENSQAALGGVVCRHELLSLEDSISFGLLCVDENSMPFTMEITAKSIEIKLN